MEIMTSPIEIDSKEPRWFAKVGMVLIKIVDQKLVLSLEDAWEENGNNRSYYEQVVDIHRDIEGVLKKCPDVKNVRWLGDLREEHFEPFAHHNALEEDFFLQESSDFLYFELFMPKSERQYAFDVRYNDKVIEKAHVIYNGMLFLAYAEIADEVSSSLFGQEIREFLKSRLVSERWEGVIVPPCPLHPDITLTFSPKGNRFQVETNEENDVEILLPFSDCESPLAFLEYFLSDNSFSICHFLSACTIEQKMKRTSWRIQEILALLTDSYAKLLVVPWYKVVNKLNLMRDSRQKVLSLQVACNEFAKDQLMLRKEREAFAPQTAETWNQNSFQSYFFKHLCEPALSLPEIRETVKHMNNIVSESYLQYSTFFAAIVGGIVGAIITNIPFVLSLISKCLIN